MERMNEALKSCPFCGDEDPSLWWNEGKYGKYIYVECDMCGARSKTFRVSGYYDDQDDSIFESMAAQKAISAWNRRRGGDADAKSDH